MRHPPTHGARFYAQCYCTLKAWCYHSPIDSTGEHMADSNREAAGAKRCAASMAGHPVSVEYSTGSDDGVPFVTVLAVHDRGHRYPAHWFHPDAISDFEDEATRTEMAADECEWGIPDERSTAPMRLAPRVAA